MMGNSLEAQSQMIGAPIEVEQLLTVHDVAKLLRVPVTWVYERTRRRGDEHLPHVKMGKYVRFRQTEIEDYLKKLRRE